MSYTKGTNQLRDKQMTTTTTAAKFVKDEIYKTRYIGDADLICFWEVQKVTAKQVTVLCLETNEVKTVKIYTDNDGNEFCFPDGKYSMALQIRATNISF